MSTPVNVASRQGKLRGILLTSMASAMGTLSLIVTIACGQYALQTSSVPSYDWTIELLLTVSIAGVGVALGAWLTIWAGISVFCVVGATIGRRSHRVEELISTHGPLIIRRLVAAALGLGLTVTAAPAFAAQDDAADSANGAGQPTAVTALGWHNSGAPSGITETPRTTPAPQAAANSQAEAGQDTVAVQTGDNLWSIAAAHLPDGASTADIASEWPTWFELNRDVIGANPDLILPGQELVNPHSND